MNHKKKRMNRNQPIYKVRAQQIKFDADADLQDEKKLTLKQSNFKITSNVKYKRDFKTKQKKVIQPRKITKKFLKETFVNNPYTYVQQEKQFQKESELMQQKNNLREDKDLQSTKLKELQQKLKKELERNQKVQLELEHAELQGTKTLSKFDCWDEDLDPQDWLNLCKQNKEDTHAKCPYFKNGKYVWVEVRVLDYCSQTKRFQVEVIEMGFVKMVSRLSLYFKREDFDKFKKRVLQCKEYQQKAEKSIPNKEVSAMPGNLINQILKRVLNNKENPNFQFEQQIVSRVIKIIRAEYLREMKKCYVAEQIKLPKNREFFEEKKITISTRQYKQFNYDIINKTNIKKSFKQKLESLQARNYTKNNHILEALKLFQSKCYTHKQKVLLDLSLVDKKMPFQLEEFLKDQQNYFDKNKETLKTQWKEYPLGDICDILRKVQHFSGSFNDIEEYQQQQKVSLKRLITRIDLIFRKHLRDFLQNNLNKWQQFLQQFIYPNNDNENWLMQNKPFIKIELKFREADKKKKKRKGTPLIYFSPSREEVYEKLTQPIQWLKDFMNSMQKLESEIVKVLGLPTKQIFDLSDEYIPIANCINTIKNFLDRAFEEPEKLLKEFQQFEFLLQNSIEDIIKTYTHEMKNQKSISNLENYLQRVVQSMIDLNRLFCNNHNTTFFQVKTELVKQNLIDKANQIKIGFLKKISSIVVKDINDITNSYTQMEDNLNKSPENENDLMILNNHIKNCDSNLEQLASKIENTYCYITLMEKYGQKFDENYMYKFWFLKISPLEVKRAYNTARRTSQEKEQIFVQILQEEKKNFEIHLENYKQDFENLKNFQNFEKVSEYAKISENLDSKLKNAQTQQEDFNNREKIFELQLTNYKELTILRNDFEPYDELWKKGFYFDSSKDSWLMSPLIKLNPKKIELELEKIKSEIRRKLLKKFEDVNNDNAIKVCKQILEAIGEFEKNLPLMKYLTQDCMMKKSNNWKKLFQQLGHKVTQQQATIQHLLQIGIGNQLENIEDFVETAAKEYKLEDELQKQILDKLESLQLTLMEHKGTGSWLITKPEEVQEKLDEFLSSVMMMKQNKYVKPIKRKVLEVERKLMGLQDLIEDWICCQRSWLYLQPIFISEDLKKKMPVEKNKFDQVDKVWQNTMKQVSQNPNIFDNFDWEKTKQEFTTCNITLDEVQHSLSEYLEAKRSDFPRFYFLSDDELIEIISKTKDPMLVTKYLSKCFSGVNSLEFRNKNEIIKVISAEGEEIDLNKPIRVDEGEKKGNVEKWLAELEEEVQTTLKYRTKECYNDLDRQRSEWLQKWPGQLVLAINSTKWTQDVTVAITDQKLKMYQDIMNQQLAEVVETIRKPLDSLQRKTLSALIVIDVHANHVVTELIKKNITKVTDFEWLSQLRYEISNKNLLNVKILNSTYAYQYEYLGNTSRLVITPLTDRCYRTLISAYGYFYGGAPEGPAGTGKTETVKDLAQAVAVQCNVFNCTDQINYIAMRKFFKGLSQTGSWCCFDEFNRILPEVLSVIAVQVRTIQNAIKERKTTFFFEGKNIRLINSCAINITMNPGYAGRSDLPDNLKALFRPCAMMVPNYSLIAEICLYSYGFQSANQLAKKIVAALRLSSEQLSSQKHYDFGMRALKSILVAAGNLKRVEKDGTEAQLCLRALQSVNLPKFTRNDIPLFNSIIEDLFPGVKPLHKSRDNLIQKMKKICTEKQLIAQEQFLKKSIEIYEMIQVRHGLMVVGQNFSGKTKALEILQEGLSRIEINVESYMINPKGVTGFQLYGQLNPDTKVWTEGVIPAVMKFCEKDIDKEEYKWVIFDGPVDAEWIENMNTVLDDNKILCLTNGQKIKLTKWMTMMFEVEDLNSASPATVSRCGMIFMEPIQLGWDTILKQFLLYKQSNLEQNLKDNLQQILQWILSYGLEFIKRCCKLPLELNQLKIVNNVLDVLQIQLLEISKIESQLTQNNLWNVCLFCVIWGMGGLLDENDRQKFEEFLKLLLTKQEVIKRFQLDKDVLNHQPKDDKIILPQQQQLFDINLNLKTFQWESWLLSDQFDTSIYQNMNFEQLIIPTQDSERNSYFIRTMLQNNKHILLTGSTGTGKTIGVLSQIIKNFSTQQISNLVTNFSGQTSANQIQKLIESRMTTRKGKKGYWGPEDNKDQLVVFIDDINMPNKEIYGAQPPIELLRMWLDYGFWYDLDTKEQKHLINMQLIATMGPPSSGRNTMTPRFLRQFFQLYVTPFNKNSLTKIYDSVLEWHFSKQSPKFLNAITEMKNDIVKATVDLFQRIKSTKEFLPTPKKIHYIFSARDIARVYQALTKSTFKSCKNGNDFIKLWAHESMRVFMDRLISYEDKSIFQQLLQDQWNNLVTQEPLLWADFVPQKIIQEDGSTKTQNGIYVELDNDNLQDTFKNLLEEYNESQQNKLNLVLFNEAIEHIVKIVRIITTPNSHGLLVGLGGLGRYSLSQLSCFIAGFSLKQIELSSNYGIKEWIVDLIEILFFAGAENMPTVFFFRDTQIFEENILEDISSLLQQGQIPGLFPNEEKMRICEQLTQTFEHTLEMSNQQKFEFFVGQCKKNLHLILSFSSVGEDLRKRIRNFPSFINNTTIDWFLEWPESALNSVAFNFLQQSQLEQEVLDVVSQICVQMHKDADDLANRFWSELKRRYYLTPANYLKLMEMFEKVYAERKTKTLLSIERYQKGVSILAQSKEKVKEMKQEIVELEPKLKEATIQTDKLIKKVELESKDADVQKNLCEKEEQICNGNRQEAEDLKSYCEAELAKVEPLLVQASKNLKSIQRNHIDFLKQIKNPHPPIKKLFQGLCYLYEIKQIPKIKDPNNPYKKISDFTTPTRNIIMAKPDQMLQKLLSYNAEKVNQMNPSIIQNLKTLQQDKEFDLELITNVSQAAGKIGGFLITVIEIYDKLQIVNPKREQLKKAESDLTQAVEVLQEKQNELTKVMQKIQKLKDELQQANDKQDFLDSELERCKRQSKAAEELVSGLESEKVSWQLQISTLNANMNTLVGDVLLSCGIMIYLGIYPIDYREQILQNWKKLLADKSLAISEDYDLKNIMANEIQIANWTNNFKLPNDSYSIDNAIMLQNSNRFCIMIDPQNQANRWIKEMEKENNLIIVRPTQRSNEVQNIIQNCLEQGYPLLFENLDETLSFNLINLLKNERKQNGKNTKFKFMENWYTLSDDFKFYATTKLSKPHYSPDICVMTSFLNFQVTPLGLEDQLLNILVAKEDPSSEKMRISSIKEFYDLKNKQKQTEDKILSLLTESGDTNILDNVNLIETLKKSKQDSKDTNMRIKVIESMKIKLQNTRNFYSKAANRASNLFFCITDLENVEPMYQFSLDWFIDLYKESLISENKNKDTRVKEIINTFLQLLLNSVLPSLFEKDKLLFSFLMYSKILQCENQTNSLQLRQLFVGGTKFQITNQNLLKDVIDDKQWALLEELEQFEYFIDLRQNIEDNIKVWKQYIQSEDIHQIQVPGKYNNISDINHLILVRILKPDFLIPLIQIKIANLLGQNFVDFPAFNIENLYPLSNAQTPIIFVIASGAEPLADIERLAEVLGKDKNFDVLSLGQGQETIAQRAIEFAQKKGKWIVLQNCHLAPSFLTTLEKLLEQGENQEFRIWLTSMPTERFPVTLLQSGIKITSEPPRGIKANMLKSFGTYNHKMLDNHPKKETWKKLLFGLSFFHSLVQERRKFASLGWNIPYEFSQMDLAISLTQTNTLLKEFENIPWQSLRYSIAEANYGGRVTDPMDRRLINVILNDFMNKISLQDSYKYSKSGIYYCPEDTDINGYKKFITQNFPLNDQPEIFGLHSNAKITSGIKETNGLMNTLLELLPRDTSQNGTNLDQIVIDKCEEFLKQIPDDFNIEIVMKKFPVKYENSMNTVLVQELMRYNKLTIQMRTSLKMLIKAIQGFVIMTEELDEIYTKILNNQVSNLWQTYSYPSVKPLSSWMINYCQRIKFMQDWITNGQPLNYWISGFFFTQSYLTGILQNYARKEKIAIDTLTFQFEILDFDITIDEAPQVGSYVYGLFMEGARWDQYTKTVQDSNPKVLFNKVPNIWIIPVEIDKKKIKHTYCCPVYKTSTRAGILSTTGHSTNYVISIDLPIDEKHTEEFWIKRGLAMICELDY